MMRNVRLVLEYDGTCFKGWQVQPYQRTVQGELEARLQRLFGKPTRTVAAGRTDTGVHALGQVVNFATASSLTVVRILRALNGILPPDIAVRGVDEVPPEFNARRSAGRREYIYRIDYRRRAVKRGYAWWIRSPLNLEAMQEAASGLLGRHDFTSFCVAAAERKNRECTLFDCTWRQQESGLQLRIEADRFLRAMVRSIVGTLVDIGRGARQVDDMPEILEARDRRCAGPSAPPHGLFLNRVTYEVFPVPSGD